MSDSVNNLRNLVYDLLSDPCFRSKILPQGNGGIDFLIQKEFEKLDHYIEFLKNEIREHE